MKALLLALLFLLSASPALAVNPDEVLADPALEARARDISADLRCLVCQNQSIDDSDAELARDLRIIVREQLQTGASDAEVVKYIVDRYGEYVLLNPVMAPHTLALWVAAPLMLLVGGTILLLAVRRKSRSTEPAGRAELTEEEVAALDALDRRTE